MRGFIPKRNHTSVNIMQRNWQHQVVRIHEIIHTKDKPYKCSHCTKNSSTSGGKTVHERTHTKEKPFKCNHCSKSFSTSSHRKIHERIHTKILSQVTGLNMKRFIPKRNRTNAAIALRDFSHHQVTRKYMKGRIPKRKHSSVDIALKCSLVQTTSQNMRGFIPKRNHSNVNIVQRSSLHQVARKYMKGSILNRNHTHLVIAPRWVSHNQTTRFHLKPNKEKRYKMFGHYCAKRASSSSHNTTHNF